MATRKVKVQHWDGNTPWDNSCRGTCETDPQYAKRVLLQEKANV
jgi:hypothetical protein